MFAGSPCHVGRQSDLFVYFYAKDLQRGVPFPILMISPQEKASGEGPQSTPALSFVSFIGSRYTLAPLMRLSHTVATFHLCYHIRTLHFMCTAIPCACYIFSVMLQGRSHLRTPLFYADVTFFECCCLLLFP